MAAPRSTAADSSLRPDEPHRDSAQNDKWGARPLECGGLPPLFARRSSASPTCRGGLTPPPGGVNPPLRRAPAQADLARSKAGASSRTPKCATLRMTALVSPSGRSLAEGPAVVLHVVTQPNCAFFAPRRMTSRAGGPPWELIGCPLRRRQDDRLEALVASRRAGAETNGKDWTTRGQPMA